MPLLTRKFQERSRTRVGVVGLLAVMLALAVAMNSGPIIRSITGDTFTAEFAEVGDLAVGDEVRLGGYVVGLVDVVELVGDRVEVEFTVTRGGTLGDRTGAAIKSASPLGKKFLQVLPGGIGEMDSGSVIPLERTLAPYDLTQVLATLTTETGRLDTRALAGSLRTLADTLANTPPELASALGGITRLSDTIASRDAELRTLLAGAGRVTGVLAERTGALQRLFADGNQLLAELYARRDAIRMLLINATEAIDQVHALTRENQARIGPTLRELEGVTDLLIRNEKALSATITGLSTYGGGLGEAVGGGPWFYAYIPNLVPANLLPDLGQLLNPAAGAAPLPLPAPSAARPGGG